jgi:peptidoglycan hydrolase-like protein with peptidoglycan-binding domain
MLPSPENLLTPYATRRRPATTGAGAGGWFDLDDWVGPGHPSGRADVAKLEAILANSGDFPMERFQGPTGYWGGALDAGIRSYQKRNGLTVDGTLRPGGPTISHMRDSFAELFDGYAPPTVEDIDAHQNIVGDDNPGTIAWRRPAVDLSQVPGLPEIDQEADASNTRLVRAMLRTGDIDGYAQLMRDAIDQGGKHALAEVRDLTQKLDEASPGLGDRFAGYVFDGMEKAKRDRLRIKMQGGQPPGTKVAITDVLGDAGMAIMGGLLGAGTIGAGIKASGDTSKINDRLPGFTPADNENKPPQAPPPALVDVPIQAGGPAPESAKPTVLSNIPPPTKEQRETFTGEFGKEFGQLLPAIIYADGEQDNRGTDETVTGNNLIARACTKRAEMSPLAGLIKHRGGASRDGEGKEYLEEKTISTKDVSESPFRRSDIAYTLEKDGNVISETHINSATTHADGSLVTREIKQIKDMAKAVGEKFIRAMRKFKKGDDEQEYFDEAFKVCDEAMTAVENDYASKFGVAP